MPAETLYWKWTRGRANYAAFLVRMTDAGVRSCFGQMIEAIGGIPGVAPYPEPYWAEDSGEHFPVEADPVEHVFEVELAGRRARNDRQHSILALEAIRDFGGNAWYVWKGGCHGCAGAYEEVAETVRS